MNILVNNRINTMIKSRYNNYEAEMSYFVVDSITEMLPVIRENLGNYAE